MPTATDDALTLEQLVQRVKDGDEDAITQLWESVRRFIHQQAYRAFQRSGGAGGAGIDDLVQQGFFALLDAAKSYDPAAGKSFVGWLDLYLRRAFADVLGYATSRRNPLDDCLSFDALLVGADGDESDTAYVDVLPDPGAQEALQSVEDTIFVDELHVALDAAIGAHLSPRAAEVLRDLYWRNETQAQVAADLGVSAQLVAERHRDALRTLRRSSSARELESFLPDGWSGTGLSAFRHRGVSSVELAVIQREQLRGGC